MAFKLNGEEPIFDVYMYKFIQKHRSPGPRDASKWKVDFRTEFDLAEESRNSNFMEEGCDKYSWNVKRSSDKLEVIGRQNSNDEIIARFDLDKNSRVMHGYPIDYVTKSANKPGNEVLKQMRLKEKISKRELRIIMQGKRV